MHSNDRLIFSYLNAEYSHDACILDKDSSLLQQACNIHELTSNDAL